MKALLSLALVAVLTGGSALAAPARPGSRSADEENIRETLFRYLFNPPADAPYEPTPYERKHHVQPLPPRPDLRHPYKVYFLEVGSGKDPSGALLQRFAGHTPVVKKTSASYVDRKAKDFAMYAVKDKATGAIGVVFRVGAVRWRDHSRAEVWAGHYSGGRNASSSLYTLTRTGRRWSVTKISQRKVAQAAPQGALVPPTVNGPMRKRLPH